MNKIIFLILLLALLLAKPSFAAISISTLGSRIDMIGDVGGVGDCDVQAFTLLDAYTYETDGSYPLLLTSAAVSYPRAKLLNSSATDFTDITDEINNGTAEDFALPPLNSTGNGTTIYIGSTDRAPNGIRINVTTAGVGTWTIGCARSTGTSTWASVTCTDGTSGFTVAGVNDISFSAQPSIKGTVNGTSAFWYRINITSCSAITTPPRASQIWIKYNAPSQPRPFDYYYTPLLIEVTNFNSSTNGTFIFYGTTATAETSETVQINDNGTFTTYQKYNSMSMPAYAMSGRFSWQIYQSRAGAISQLITGTGDDKQYYLYGRINLSSNPSDGSYRTCLSEQNKQLFLRDTTNQIIVYNNSRIDFGSAVDEDDKTCSDGVSITGLVSNYYRVYEGGVFNFYCGKMTGGRLNAYNFTSWYSTLENVQLKQCINCDLTGNTLTGQSYINPEGAFSGTFAKNRFIGAYAVFYMTRMGTSNILFTDTYIRGRTATYDIGISPAGSNPYYNYTFRDNDYDEWAINPLMNFLETNDTGRAWIFEDYTNTINVRFPNGTAVNGATVDVTPLNDGLYKYNSTVNISTTDMCYIQNSTSVTDSSGNWSAVMLYNFSRANSTLNMQFTQCSYTFNITSGNLSYSFNDTIQNGKGRPYEVVYLNATGEGSGTSATTAKQTIICVFYKEINDKVRLCVTEEGKVKIFFLAGISLFGIPLYKKRRDDKK